MTCHNCRIDCSKAGKRGDGLQRYRCGKCSKTYSEHKEFSNLCGHKQAIDDESAVLALRLLAEGNSIRSAERITGLHRDTIMKLLAATGERCEALLATKIQKVLVRDVQCDEVWTFVFKKESRRGLGDRNYHWIGDAWAFIAIERNTKLVLTFELGRRNTGTAVRFMKKLAAATSVEQGFQLTTDGFPPYNFAVGNELDNRCDYAQLVKIYAAPTPEEQRRYSPAHVVEAIPTEIYGDPENERICTSHIERQNGSLRQWCKRFTRLTYGFSKKWGNLNAALALHFAHYNFCRVHGSLRITPAMASGITDHIWTISELLQAA